MATFFQAYVMVTSENAIVNPPAIAPIGLPNPPTIAAAKIGNKSWNSVLFIINFGLISAVMALGVNLQW
ncbi:MAG: hypothetical protein P8H90_02910, partial [Tateyamaria sp.]|nr:hypothetical protein [Tateyamaria sp.]